MSFVAPSTAVIALTTGDMEVAYGSLRIDMYMRDRNTSFNNNYSFDVLDVGTLEADFDFLEQVSDVTDFKLNLPNLQLTIRDTVNDTLLVSQRESFMDMAGKLELYDLIVIKVTYANNAAEYYYTTKEQLDYSYMKRTVTIKAQSPIKYKTEPYGVSSSWSGSIFTNYLESRIGGGNVVYVRDFIRVYLNHTSVLGQTIVESDVFSGQSVDQPVNLGQYFMLEDDPSFTGAPTPFNDFLLASELIKTFALADGAIVGNMFGTSFYMPRYRKNNFLYRVPLYPDDFEEFEIDFSFRNIRRYQLNVDYGRDGLLLSLDQTPNESGANDVNVNFVTNSTEYGVYEFVNTSSAYQPKTSGINIPSSTSRDKVADAYRDVFRIPRSGPAGAYISGKIIGMGKLPAFKYFQVQNGVHPFVDGKDFRPSMLKYDLLNDIIEFEAYEF